MKVVLHYKGGKTRHAPMKVIPEYALFQQYIRAQMDEKMSYIPSVSKIEVWKKNYHVLVEMIEKNNRFPFTCCVTENDRKFRLWFEKQKDCYNALGPEYSKRIMTVPEVHHMWKDAIEKYNLYYIYNLYNDINEWKDTACRLIHFINENNYAPGHYNDISTPMEEKKLSMWVKSQNKSFNKSGYLQSKGLMKIPKIYNSWKSIFEQKKHYLSNKYRPLQKWRANLRKLKEFIKENNRLPSVLLEAELYTWVQKQKDDFTNLNMQYVEMYEEWRRTVEENDCFRKKSKIGVQDNITNEDPPQKKRKVTFYDGYTRTPRYWVMNKKESNLIIEQFTRLTNENENYLTYDELCSWDFIKYLIGQYGEEKVAEKIASVSNTPPVNVYQFNIIVDELLELLHYDIVKF